METTKRLACKALTWQLLGLVGMSAIGYVMTGSMETAGSFALASAAVGMLLYFLHEKVWAAVPWGLRDLRR